MYNIIAEYEVLATIRDKKTDREIEVHYYFVDKELQVSDLEEETIEKVVTEYAEETMLDTATDTDIAIEQFNQEYDDGVEYQDYNLVAENIVVYAIDYEIDEEDEE